MPDYKKGKIYCIRSPHIESVYIGSTTMELCRRMTNHRSKTCRSKSIIEAGDAYIELVEEYPCDNKEQLNRREGEIMRITPNCINRCIAGRTTAEYYRDNIDKKLQYQKKYYETHKEKNVGVI